MVWSLAGGWTWTSNVPQVDIIGLAGFNEIFLLVRNTSVSGIAAFQYRVSTNNGSSFLSASGDYKIIGTTGLETNDTLISASGGSGPNGSVLVNYILMFRDWNKTSEKTVHTPNDTTWRLKIMPVASALNAIRLFNSTGANFTAGAMYAYGRNAAAPWKTLGAQTISVATGAVQFNNFPDTDYDDFKIIIDDVPASVSGIRSVQVSTDNGATWLTTSGDYRTVTTINTAEVNASSIPAHTAAGTAASSAYVDISQANLTLPKVARHSSRGNSFSVIPVASKINAVRVINDAGGNLTAGTVTVFGRPSA